jgi:acetoin utilization deacetylase AcuC-like enzyme
MATLIFTHPDCLDHDTGPGHPERPQRLKAIWQALEADEFKPAGRRIAPEASLDQLARVHSRSYIEGVLADMPIQGYLRLDPDTVLSPRSRSAILRAAGSVSAAVDAVMSGEADNAFCAVRPCGHHAEPEKAKGFCVFNNIAVGAEQARKVHGLKRVAVVDFDVHHGNGTQAMFWSDPDLFFASTHQFPFYPGTGASGERGEHGNIVNVPLTAFSGSGSFRDAYTSTILPALDDFAPDLILISAGFDAHERDPLAQLELEAEDFAWITREILAIARRRCGAKVVSVLEGGYDLTALAESCALHVRELMKG